MNAEEGEPLLVHGLVSTCILDADLMGVESVWIIERLRRRDAKTPIIAFTSNSQSEWEEEAFLRGVTHVLTKPLRARLLNSVLERLASTAPLARQAPNIPSGNTAQDTWISRAIQRGSAAIQKDGFPASSAPAGISRESAAAFAADSVRFLWTRGLA